MLILNEMQLYHFQNWLTNAEIFLISHRPGKMISILNNVNSSEKLLQ